MGIICNIPSGKGSGGGGGISFPLNPPSDVTISGANGEVTISWVNPSDLVIEGVTLARFIGVKIVRKVGANPENPTDGTTVYNGNMTSFTESGLDPDTRYYYGLFAYNESNVYSEPTYVNVQPSKFSIKLWTNTIGLDYETFDDIPEKDMAKLFFTHASCDYFYTLITESTDTFNIAVTKERVVRWIGQSDYMWDKIVVVESLRNALLNSDYWELILMDRNPALSALISNTSAYRNDEIASKGYAAYAFDYRADTSTGSSVNTTSNQYVGYTYSSKICVNRARVRCTQVAKTIEIQAKNSDTATWTTLCRHDFEEYSATSPIHDVILTFNDNINCYTDYRVYLVESSVACDFSVFMFNMFGRYEGHDYTETTTKTADIPFDCTAQEKMGIINENGDSVGSIYISTGTTFNLRNLTFTYGEVFTFTSTTQKSITPDDDYYIISKIMCPRIRRYRLSPLPDGFDRWGYVGNGNTDLYIDTGISLLDGMGVYADYQPTSFSSSSFNDPFGSQDLSSGDSATFSFLCSTITNTSPYPYYIEYGRGYNYQMTRNSNRMKVMVNVYNDNKLVINGDTVRTDAAIYDQVHPTNMYLFSGNIYYSPTNNGRRPFTGRFYKFIITLNDKIIANFIPCRTVGNQRLGFYEVISNTFHPGIGGIFPTTNYSSETSY